MPGCRRASGYGLRPAPLEGRPLGLYRCSAQLRIVDLFDHRNNPDLTLLGPFRAFFGLLANFVCKQGQLDPLFGPGSTPAGLAQELAWNLDSQADWFAAESVAPPAGRCR